ncbi:FAD-dependent oxidoreductase [Vibrio marisflavi]|uniref:Fumarate reductase/succinate dehydrogenase flavoprotein-like C-terminal domain-containing protein n=1 Tax=Vibrio marisflavi CECT 7928 TaxID=634439 RepID=A0ABM8ZZL5_9VIBR|nr:FAD-binding protein [Vibrio marisflavi]CAH0536513.1 hypothetical protein VMF7928_00460 [Vibrio marisflavi CECT 7928]
MKDNLGMSRRKFLGVAGGAALGIAALSAMSFEIPVSENKSTIKPSDFDSEDLQADVLVIGGGMAALFAAIKAHDAGASVLMVSKGRVGSSGLTPFAKGIFCYDKSNADMTIDEFVKKVSDSAIDTNNPVFTRQLAEHSYDRVQELKSWGFFESPIYHKAFNTPLKERNIRPHERVMITHLTKENGHIAGASGFSLDENKLYHYRAKTVVLCTGSGGFKSSGFPLCDVTHDGTIMAYKIGAKVTGKEWNDGHPGSAKNSGDCYSNWRGQVEEKPSITSAEVHHDLGVDLNFQAYTQGPPVEMGPPGSSSHSAPTQTNIKGPYTPSEFQRKGPPSAQPERGGILSIFNKADGGPPGPQGEIVGGSTAGMAIHKSEGIVPVDETGLSTIPGLYAAGDALGSYMSGGIYTQVGGSLAGSAVQGTFAGEAAAKASKELKHASISVAKLKQIESEILAPLKRERGYSPAWVTQVLQGVMFPNFVLYIKKERMLQGALAYVEELQEHHVPMLLADDLHKLRLAHETENMIANAQMKLKASMMRKESRCSHYRLDYPSIDRENWQAWINIQKDDSGEMVLEKQPFNLWPKFS